MDTTSTDYYDYQLPEELIAQEPPAHRGESRMLTLDRQSGQTSVTMFSALVDYLRPGDCLVFNDTKVMKARLYGRKNALPDGAKVEILLLSVDHLQPRRWSCLLKPGKRLPVGTRVQLIDHQGAFVADGGLTVLSKADDGAATVEFDSDRVFDLQEKCGHIPLPPYIRRDDNEADYERYQTIFARQAGAVAAPTAGLHFTQDVLDRLTAKGVLQANVTLHVGLGTFRPVEVADIRQHAMHFEECFISPETADRINQAKAAGGRILAVGTTSVRTLESCADEQGFLSSQSRNTNIFIYPPYRFKVVDMLLTNFHLPKSTLLMLVSALAGRDHVLAAYQTAIDERMRFFSYGDCMLIH